MATDTTTVPIEVWVLVDEEGAYSVGETADQVATRYAEEIGDSDAIPKRLVRATIAVPLPRVAELVGVVPPEPSGGELRVV